jgi:hypothetical protein
MHQGLQVISFLPTKPTPPSRPLDHRQEPACARCAVFQFEISTTAWAISFSPPCSRYWDKLMTLTLSSATSGLGTLQLDCVSNKLASKFSIAFARTISSQRSRMSCANRCQEVVGHSFGGCRLADPTADTSCWTGLKLKSQMPKQACNRHNKTPRPGGGREGLWLFAAKSGKPPVPPGLDFLKPIS